VLQRCPLRPPPQSGMYYSVRESKITLKGAGQGGLNWKVLNRYCGNLGRRSQARQSKRNVEAPRAELTVVRR
jgi:hypothetical protein